MVGDGPVCNSVGLEVEGEQAKGMKVLEIRLDLRYLFAILDRRYAEGLRFQNQKRRYQNHQCNFECQTDETHVIFEYKLCIVI